MYTDRLDDYKKADGKKLSQKSKDLYIRTMTKLITDHGWDFRIEKMKPFLSQFSQSHQANYINTLMNYLSVMSYDDAIIGIYRDFREEIKSTPYEMSKQKKDNCCEWDDILRWRDHIIKQNRLIEETGICPIHKLQVEALLRLYTTYQRRNEYADLIFFDDSMPIPDHENCIFYDTSKNKLYLMLGDFKTKDKYGKQILEITDTEDNMGTKTFLLKYIIQNNKNPIMFTTRALGRSKEVKQLTRLNLTKLLNRSSQEILQKNISTDRIRKAYNTSKYKVMKEQLLKDSINNSHSPNVILQHYTLS